MVRQGSAFRGGKLGLIVRRYGLMAYADFFAHTLLPRGLTEEPERRKYPALGSPERMALTTNLPL